MLQLPQFKRQRGARVNQSTFSLLLVMAQKKTNEHQKDAECVISNVIVYQSRKDVNKTTCEQCHLPLRLPQESHCQLLEGEKKT